jgi:hypothetical protein
MKTLPLAILLTTLAAPSAFAEKICGEVSTYQTGHPIRLMYAVDGTTLLFKGPKGFKNLKALEAAYSRSDSVCVEGENDTEESGFDVESVDKR